MAELDDQGYKPRPTCEDCAERSASWLVVGLIAEKGDRRGRWKVCTSCVKAPETVGRKRALRASDY